MWWFGTRDDKEEIQMTRCVFYMACKQNGEEEVEFHDKSSVQELGGLSALEITIHRTSNWYSPLGEAEVPPHLTDPHDPEFVFGIIRPLIESWVEKGAPILKGALDDGTTATLRPKFARRYFFYKFCNKNGREQVCYQTEAQVEEHGGIEALEAAMAEQTSRFYPLGSLLFPAWIEREGGVVIPLRRAKALVDAWLEQGSPWKLGKFARDVDAPPNSHPLAKEGA
jgi:hypothetical protein